MFLQEPVFDPTRTWAIKAVTGHGGLGEWMVRWQGEWEDTREPTAHLRPDGLRAVARYVAAARASAQVDDPVTFPPWPRPALSVVLTKLDKTHLHVF